MSYANTDEVVYTAGPITGLSFAGCTEWRAGVAKELATKGIKAVSPMRGKEYLEKFDSISADGTDYAHMSPLSLPKGVVVRDHWDVIRCKVLFVNLLQRHIEPAKRIVSIGTVAEIAWKWHVQGPIVLVMEKDGWEEDGKVIYNNHRHMFVTEMATYQVETLDAGMRITEAIMLNAF
jgi:hypothetical protein